MSNYVILGGNSGMARAMARLLAAPATKLFLCGRNEQELQRFASELKGQVETRYFDALDVEAHREMLLEAFESLGEVDGLFLFFGVMYPQEDCDRSWDKVSEMIACNVTGVISLLEVARGLFAKQARGFISCVTSVAGDRGRASNYVYGATKAAVNVYLQGLRAALHPSNVLVQTVRAGPTDTPMARRSASAPLIVSADYVAAKIWAALRQRREEIYVPWYWRYIMMAVQHIPEPIFKRLKF